MTVFDPPKTSSLNGRDAFDGSAIRANLADLWTFAAVEERLIDALDLWRRSPGGGKWPFAGDAPWHLMTRLTRIAVGVEGGLKGRELQLHLQAEDAEETRRWQGRERKGALTRDEVARRDEATEWLAYAGDDARKVVIEVLKQRASGRTNVDWRRVKAGLGAEIEVKGLYRRYTRAITAIARRLNGAPANALA